MNLATTGALDRKGVPERVLLRIIGPEVRYPSHRTAVSFPRALIRLAGSSPLELRGEFECEHGDVYTGVVEREATV